MGETADAGQQHLRALENANQVRIARAEIKRRVAEGELSAADVVLHCPWQAHRMSVSTLLTAQKRWGGARCRRILVSIGVAENRPVGALTERQRMALVTALRSKARPSDGQPAAGALTAV
jgi:hypothetical protein